MARILLIDYLGQCDEFDKPVGHAAKTIDQYGLLLNEDNEVDVLICENYSKYISKEYFSNVFHFKYKCTCSNIGKKEKVKNTLFKIKNIFSIKNYLDYDNIIFINIDFMLGLYARKIRYKYIVIQYMEKYCFGNKYYNKVKNALFSKVIRYSKGRIVSRKSNNFEKVLEVPDFLYIKNIYSKYENLPKKNEFLMIGTISDEKDIESIVNIFKNREEKLNVVGKFYNNDLYERISKVITNNIKLENKIVDYNEYYRLIAEHKFVILPYKKEFYNGRSSGVLLESIFLNSIPIAPKFLLDTNEVSGLSYNNISEFEEILNDLKNNKSIFRNYNKSKEKFDKEIIQEKLNIFLKNV